MSGAGNYAVNILLLSEICMRKQCIGCSTALAVSVACSPGQPILGYIRRSMSGRWRRGSCCFTPLPGMDWVHEKGLSSSSTALAIYFLCPGYKPLCFGWVRGWREFLFALISVTIDYIHENKLKALCLKISGHRTHLLLSVGLALNADQILLEEMRQLL